MSVERRKRGPSTFARDMMRKMCKSCMGTGKRQIFFRDFSGDDEPRKSDFTFCPECNGTGISPSALKEQESQK